MKHEGMCCWHWGQTCLPGSGFGFGSGAGRGIGGLISGTKIIHSNKQIITVYFWQYIKDKWNWADLTYLGRY